jgi:hypothetical protein
MGSGAFFCCEADDSADPNPLILSRKRELNIDKISAIFPAWEREPIIDVLNLSENNLSRAIEMIM